MSSHADYWREQEARNARDRYRLLELVDRATDSSWDSEMSDRGTRDEDDRYRDGIVLERTAAALGAIAYLLLRQDEEMWEAWKRY